MLFTELLSKSGIERTGVSHGLQQKMKRYDKFVKLLAIEKEKLKTPNVKNRAQIEKDITEGEENMAALNDEICTGVEKYIANKDLNDKKAAILKKARESKEAKKGTPAATTTIPFTVEGVAKKIADGEKITDANESAFYDANKEAIDAEVTKLTGTIEHEVVEGKKKSKTGTVVAVVATTLFFAACAILGIKAYKDSKKS